jgi:hypothetical protein
VPERLSELNWIDWQPGNLGATFGFVLAGLLSDPAQRDLSRQLSHEAEAWQRGGRRNEMLIADYRRARRMVHVLRDLERDKLAAPHDDQLRAAFGKCPRRLTGVSATGSAASRDQAWNRYNHATAIRGLQQPRRHCLTGDLSFLPEWSAANAAALQSMVRPPNAPWRRARCSGHERVGRLLQTLPPPFTAATFATGPLDR